MRSNFEFQADLSAGAESDTFVTISEGYPSLANMFYSFYGWPYNHSKLAFYEQLCLGMRRPDMPWSPVGALDAEDLCLFKHSTVDKLVHGLHMPFSVGSLNSQIFVKDANDVGRVRCVSVCLCDA